MRVLAFDTSTAVTAVAVTDGARVLVEDQRTSPDRHGETLLPRVRDALREAGLALAEVELLAVGTGPGSFTGLRIGLATAKGLALATGTPLRGVCSLRALASGVAGRAELIATAFDAGKGEVFFAAFSCEDGTLQERLAPQRALPQQALATLAALVRERAPGSILACGAGMRRYPELFAGLGASATLADADDDVPRGRSVAQQALLLMQQQGPSDLGALEPTYLRESLEPRAAAAS